MSNNEFFKVYTSDATVSLDFPFHISRSIVTSNEQDFVNLVNQEHSHEFMQMLYILNGQITNEIAGRKEIIKKGELVIIPPFVKHRNDYFEGADIFTVSFMPSIIDSSFDTPFAIDDSPLFSRSYFVPFIEMGKDHSLIKKLHFITAETLVLKDLFWSIYDDFNESSESVDLSMHANFTKVLALISRHYQHNKIQAEKIKQSPHHKHYNKVQNSIQYIQENFHKDLKINDLINLCKISGTYYRMIFKDITGKSFVQYLNELRIYHAIVMIKKTSLNLNEISYEVGFSEFQNFHRTFRRIIGCSPSVYRKTEMDS
ncbi:MAG: AraC family transcriptional regulator [Lentisphaeraceae bacterium]|nr:AraC family transcriptional regulator [Lentisphaeraceae bacterium]